ncbi:acyl transferase/acyl hydrolase/lysophospholipase [Phakopsora pachyrhizi]|nr:acyl transferase/acyl hydrolase/lysophospholipase [Phakopsora pachyrhizi]
MIQQVDLLITQRLINQFQRRKEIISKLQRFIIYQPTGSYHHQYYYYSSSSSSNDDEPSKCPDFYYPTSSSSHNTSSNSLIIDPDYVQRYRDPSRHDSYDVIDHHQPYRFRIKNSTGKTDSQKITFDRSSSSPYPPQSFDTSHTSLEARLARLKMERSWLSPQLRNNFPISVNKFQRREDSRIAICFPGTGSQYIGMGSFLSNSRAFKQTWKETEESLIEFESWRKSLDLVERFKGLGYDDYQAETLGGPMRRGAMMSGRTTDDEIGGLKDVVFRGPQNELTRSSNSQPAILTTSIAYLRALENDFQVPIRSRTVAYAGHSSGEFTACVAAGVINFRDAIKLTRLLGLLTTRVSRLRSIEPYTSKHSMPHHRSQMSAILINTPKYSLEDVNRVVESMTNSHRFELPVEIASVNSSSQIILSGTRAGVLATCEKLHELEIANRAADLPCFSPFHCSFMKPASEGMKIAVDSINFSRPSKPMIYSTSGYKILKPKIFKQHLVDSISKPVWWSKTLNEMLRSKVNGRTVEKILFFGPGRALNNLCKKELLNTIKSSRSNSTIKQDYDDDVNEIKIELRSLATPEEFKIIKEEIF